MIINIANYVKYNIVFVMMAASITSRCDFENSQIPVQDTLLASRVMIYHVSHSSCQKLETICVEFWDFSTSNTNDIN